MPRLVLNPNETWEFIAPDDKGVDGKAKSGCPVFQIGHLPQALRKHIANTTSTYRVSSKKPDAPADVVFNAGSRTEICAQYGVKGISIDGVPATWFKTERHAAYNCDRLTEETLEVIRYYVDTLGNEVWGTGELTKDQEKNSEPPSA
jgi:hypothetical protein